MRGREAERVDYPVETVEDLWQEGYTAGFADGKEDARAAAALVKAASGGATAEVYRGFRLGYGDGYGDGYAEGEVAGRLTGLERAMALCKARAEVYALVEGSARADELWGLYEALAVLVREVTAQAEAESEPAEQGEESEA